VEQSVPANGHNPARQMDALDEELLAVEAIFPECISRDRLPARQLSINSFSESRTGQFALQLYFPAEYPNVPPVVISCRGIPESLAKDVIRATWTPGEVLLYALIDALRELYGRTNGFQTEGDPLESQINESSSPERSDGDKDVENFNFAISNPIIDRKSTFVGRAIEVHSRDEVRAALHWLKTSERKIAKATHNIVAWRLVENGVLMQGTTPTYSAAHVPKIMTMTARMPLADGWHIY
jgi:Uncharacterized protein family UPF0029/RWD domain